MSVRASHRRQAAARRAPEPRWAEPAYGDYYVRSHNQAVYTVKAVYSRDRQVKLAPCLPGDPVYVFAADLEREWERVVR